MNKEKLSLMGKIVSLIVALCGLLVMFGVFGGDADYATGASFSYDNGYASFGADFYTYVSNNAAEAASAAQKTAANLVEIADLLRNSLGIFLTGFGLMGFCFFGMLNCDGKTVAETKAEVNVEAVETATETEEEILETDVVSTDELEIEETSSETDTQKC